jgi:hypothetical protein
LAAIGGKRAAPVSIGWIFFPRNLTPFPKHYVTMGRSQHWFAAGEQAHNVEPKQAPMLIAGT